MASVQRLVSVLGSTGSIGVNTLDVIARHPDRFAVFGLAAHSSVQALLDQCLAFRPRYAVMMDEAAAESLRAKLPPDSETEVLQGEAGLQHIASAPQVDTVMAAIVGAAGLPSALAAAQAGKTLLLANKESLVCAGGLLMQTALRHGARLLPVDSEHSAVFQGLVGEDMAAVERIVITASGGAFRDWPLADLKTATVAQASSHPNWDMGKKKSVDRFFAPPFRCFHAPSLRTPGMECKNLAIGVSCEWPH